MKINKNEKAQALFSSDFSLKILTENIALLETYDHFYDMSVILELNS